MDRVTTTCLNCGNAFEGEYCPHCGQKANTKRLRLTETVNNFVGSFVGGDNKFLCTCRDLFIRPGHMIREYMQGKRIGYYNPLQLFVFLLTAYAILSYVLNVSDTIFDDMTTINFETDTQPTKYEYLDFVLKNITKISSNKLYGNIVLSSFAALSFQWAFRKYRIARPDGQQLPLNLTEQFYTQMYHSCIGMFLSIVMLPLCLIKGFDGFLTTVYYIITTIYIIVLYRQLYNIQWWKSVLLNCGGMILTMLIFFIVLMLVAVTAGVAEGVKG